MYLQEPAERSCHPINPLVPSAHKSARIAKISILKLEGILKKKIPMSVVTIYVSVDEKRLS